MRIIELNLNRQELRKLLESSIEFGLGDSTFYQLLKRNCATTVLDLAIAAKGKIPPRGNFLKELLDPLRGISLTLPIGTIQSLYDWNLVSSPAETLSLP